LISDRFPVSTAFLGGLPMIGWWIEYERHLKHPVASFAAGTWVASISVTVVAIVKEKPEVSA
jgi:hypothetical protein